MRWLATILLVVALTACGGDGGTLSDEGVREPTIPPDAYRDRITEVIIEPTIAAIRQVSTLIAAAIPQPGLLTTDTWLADFDAGVTMWQDVHATAQALNPPTMYEDAHAALLKGTACLSDAGDQLRQILDSSTPMDTSASELVFGCAQLIDAATREIDAVP